MNSYAGIPYVVVMTNSQRMTLQNFRLFVLKLG